jgi:integrase
MADGVLQALRVVCDWFAIRNEDFHSPIIKGMARIRPKDRMRSRVLSDDELRRVWKACDSMGVFGNYVQFLLLTCTRRNEAARIRRSEVSDGGDWLIPSSRYKSKHPHLIPLSKAAQALLAKQSEIAGCDFFFSADGSRPVGGFGQGKAALDRLSGVTNWRLHDVRRTSRTLLSRAGINADVAEIALGHALGSLRRTYDQHEYHREKQTAFEALAAEVELIVNPSPPAAVIPLRR